MGQPPRRLGRYEVFDAFASGGMATVHLGRLVADRGFSKLVAVKVLLRDRPGSSYFAKALEEEAKVAARIRHPNVVSPLDVVEDGVELALVMEYVHGVSLAELLAAARREGETLPPVVAVAILVDVLRGLHAAHEATDERGRPLGIVHRDVSPQNVLVGADGVARLADFGVAKVMRRDENTQTGLVKGKPAYMPPEQLRGFPLSRQADVYAAGIVLAEALGANPPVTADDVGPAWHAELGRCLPEGPLRTIFEEATRAASRERFSSAAEMGSALANALTPAQADEVGRVVSRLAGDVLDVRAELERDVEAAPAVLASTTTPRTVPATVDPLAASTVAAASSRRTRAPLAMLVAFFVVATVAVVALRSRGAADTRAGTPLVADPSPQPMGAPVVLPAPGASSVAIATPRASASAVAPTGPKSPSRRRGAFAPPVDDCDPPFRVGADGIRHYKPGCIK